MPETTEKAHLSLAVLTKEQPEAADATYLAWKAAKVRKARDDARRKPDELISLAAMRARFGLED